MPLLWPHRNGHSAGGGPGGNPEEIGRILAEADSVEDSLEAVTKEIYWEVGSRCGRKWTAVERNIRTAVQIAWRTNPELLREMAGYPLDGPPTASEFLEILSNDVQRAMERREEGVSSTPGI